MVSQRSNWEGYGESGLEARGADPPNNFCYLSILDSFKKKKHLMG